MASQSKYSDRQVDALLGELLLVLEKQQAPTDLSLMVLGNAVSHILQRDFASPTQREFMAEAFAQALKGALKR